MWAMLFIAVIVGVLAARLVVAESDAHRLGLPDRWWKPQCPDCGGDLTLMMLHCRSERHPQRRSNALVLIGLPILLILMAIEVPSLWVWPAYTVYVIALVLLGVTDLDTKLIPNRILGPSILAFAIALVAGWIPAQDSGSLVRALLGALAYFAVMYLLALVARGGLGFGDVKLAFLIGMATGFLGWGPVVLAGVLGFLIGGLISILLLISGKLSRKDAIPFGPFMVIAGLISALWGVGITDWYLG